MNSLVYLSINVIIRKHKSTVLSFKILYTVYKKVIAVFSLGKTKTNAKSIISEI